MLQLLLLAVLLFCFVIPGLIYYIVVVSKARKLQNIVVTTTPKEPGCDVVVSYAPQAAKLVNNFLAALP